LSVSFADSSIFERLNGTSIGGSEDQFGGCESNKSLTKGAMLSSGPFLDPVALVHDFFRRIDA
jgi:hypothetical protein